MQDVDGTTATVKLWYLIEDEQMSVAAHDSMVNENGQIALDSIRRPTRRDTVSCKKSFSYKNGRCGDSSKGRGEVFGMKVSEQT